MGSMAAHRLLVVDDDPEDLDSTRCALVRHGFAVDTAGSGPEALRFVEPDPTRYAVIILDFDMAGMNGAEITRKLKALNPDLFILIFSGHGTLEAFTLPMRQGACAFVDKGEGMDVFFAELRKLVRRYEEESILVSDIRNAEQAQKIISSIGMVGCSKSLARAVEKIWHIRARGGPVLIIGETGTGKELAAKALHHNRPGRLVTINCGDFLVSKETARSELFGHVKGSFTNATADKKGAFEDAKDGSINIDEAHHLPLDMQVALHRVLENGTVTPVGSTREIPVSCRVVASAKPELFEMVAKATFREDLFQRIAENIIRLPKLSQRPEDIPLLAEHFCKVWAERNGETRLLLSNTIPLLQSLPWPGNVRELRNVVFSALTNCKTKKAGCADVKGALEERGIIKEGATPPTGSIKEETASLRRARVLKALAQSTSLRGAARLLGVEPSAVCRYAQRHGINAKEIIGKGRNDRGEPQS